MKDNLSGSDIVIIGAGIAAFLYFFKSGGAGSTLLDKFSKGVDIVTNKESWQPQSYTLELLKAPFTADQAWRLFKQQPGISEFLNAAATSLGLWT